MYDCHHGTSGHVYHIRQPAPTGNTVFSTKAMIPPDQYVCPFTVTTDGSVESASAVPLRLHPSKPLEQHTPWM